MPGCEHIWEDMKSRPIRKAMEPYRMAGETQTYREVYYYVTEQTCVLCDKTRKIETGYPQMGSETIYGPTMTQEVP